MRLMNVPGGGAGLRGLVPVLVLLAVAGGATAASASRGSVFSPARLVARSATFCQWMVVVDKSGGSMFKSRSPAVVKSGTGKFRSIEPTVLEVTPSAARDELEKVFAFDNFTISALAKVHYIETQLSPATLRAIEKGDELVKSPYDALVAHADKTCGLTIPPLQ